MEYNLTVDNMQNGDETEGYYIITRAEVKRTATGKNYLNAILADCTGSIPAKMWDFNRTLDENIAGSVVKVKGNVSEYNGALQFTIRMLRKANEQDQYDLSKLVASAPINRNEPIEEVQHIVDSIEDNDYRFICNKLLERHIDSFISIPAAKSIHHSFRSGLLMHTLNMLRIANFLAVEYSDFVDRSLLLAGTLLHDIAKEKEFIISGLGLVSDYSIRGNLIGHLVMGAEDIASIAKEYGVPENKSVLLQHMILSHHGTPELGAAVLPKCAESELLAMIDQMDAHMEVYREALQNVPVGSFSDRIFALDKRIYNHG